MNIGLRQLDKNELELRLEELLLMESDWTGAGETLWQREHFLKELPDKFDLSLIAYSGDEVAGYLVGSSADERTAKLNKILTSQKYRGQGIGSRLWSNFLENLRLREFERLEFKVLPDNENAIRLYDKKGCIFDGMTLGTDDKERHNVYYTIQTSLIPPSSLTINEDEVNAAVETISSRNIGKGKKVQQLTETISEHTGKNYAVATNSGANALFISLRSLGIEEGSEVILPSYLCGSVLHAVDMSRASPVFADINEDEFNISYEDVLKKVNENTQAIIVPNLFGKVAKDIEKIKSTGIPIIEDCAQSLGAHYRGKPAGSFGDISIFSLHPTKMAASPSGGLAVTNDEDLNYKMQDLLKNDNREVWDEAYSMNMNDLSAAIALSQFSKIPDFIERRREIAQYYHHILSDYDVIHPLNDEGDAFFRYVLRSKDSREIIENLNSRGIQSRKPVFKPLHQYMGLNDNEFPKSTKVYEEAFYLPIYPTLTHEQARDIAGSLKNWRYEQ